MTPSSNEVGETPSLEQSLVKLAASVETLLTQNDELRRLGQAIVDDRDRPLMAPSRRAQLVNDLADYLESIS